MDTVPENSLLWHTSRGSKTKGTIGGFTSISASADSMTVSFYDQDGTELYTTDEIAPRTMPMKL